MKNCSELGQFIPLYVDDGMNGTEQHEFEEHLQSCPRCRSEVDEILQVVGMCRDMEEVELPVNFKEELHHKLLNVKQQSRKNRIFPIKNGMVRALSSIAAALFLVFAVKGFYDHGYLSPAKTGMAVEKNAADQAPQALMAEAMESAKEADNQGMIVQSNAAGKQEASDGSVATAGALQQKSSDRSVETRGIKAAEGSKLLIRKNVGVIVTMNPGIEPEKQRNELKEFAQENGAKLADAVNFEGIKSTFTIQAVPDEAVVNLKVSDLYYEQFLNTLIAKYGQENVQVENPDIEDLTVEIENLNTSLANLDKKLKAAEENEKKAASDEADEIKAERDAVLAEIERLELDSGFTFITVRVKSSE